MKRRRKCVLALIRTLFAVHPAVEMAVRLSAIPAGYDTALCEQLSEHGCNPAFWSSLTPSNPREKLGRLETVPACSTSSNPSMVSVPPSRNVLRS